MTHDHASQLLAVFALHAVGGDVLSFEAPGELPALPDRAGWPPRGAAAFGNSVEPLPDGLWSTI